MKNSNDTLALRVIVCLTYVATYVAMQCAISIKRDEGKNVLN